MNVRVMFDVMATLLACTHECKDLVSLEEATLIKPQNLFFFIVMYSSTFLFLSVNKKQEVSMQCYFVFSTLLSCISPDLLKDAFTV